MSRRRKQEKPLIIGLDTNALSALNTPEIQAVSASLRQAVVSGRVRVPLTYPLAMEVRAAFRNEKLHAELVSLLSRLCRDRMLPWPEREKMEVLHGRRLKHREVFEPCVSVVDELEAMADPRDSMRGTTPIDAIKVEFREQMQDAKERSPERRKSNGMDRNQWKSQFGKIRKNPRSAVKTWLQAAVDQIRAELDLNAPRRPDSERLPTLWLKGCYHLGLVKLYEEGGAPEDGDLLDWYHVMSAAYLDHFVTQEKRIRHIMRWAPVPSGKFVDVQRLGSILASRD